MRVTHYEIRREVDGGRLAVYTVEVARRRFIITRRLGSAQMRVHRRRPTAVGASAPRAGANPHTRRRRGFGPA